MCRRSSWLVRYWRGEASLPVAAFQSAGSATGAGTGEAVCADMESPGLQRWCLRVDRSTSGNPLLLIDQHSAAMGRMNARTLAPSLSAAEPGATGLRIERMTG